MTEIKKFRITKKILWGRINDELNSSQNDLGQVLLVMLWCEFFLEMIIKEKFPDILVKDREEMMFGDKRIKLESFFDDVLNKDLKCLNKIRNIIAHNMITDNDPEILQELSNHSNNPSKPMAEKMSLYLQVRYAGFDSVQQLFNHWSKLKNLG